MTRIYLMIFALLIPLAVHGCRVMPIEGGGW